MKLWLIFADTNGYDVYDSAVVRAADAESAKRIHPSGTQRRWGDSTWVRTPNDVSAVELGVALDNTEGVVLASFNAG
jgi:hypothetical protein